MPNQVVYESNFNYEATYERLCQSGIAIVEKTEKGLIWLRFKDTKTVFLLSPGGRIQVRWANLEEKKVLLKILKNMLVPLEGQNVSIKPLKQQLFIEYPPPPNFKLYWCETSVEYAKHAEFEPQLKEAVEKAVEELRLQLCFLREPTVKEVAAKIGKTPETVRPLLYELAPKIGWKEQDGEEAEMEAEEIINLSGVLKWLQNGQQDSGLAKKAEAALKAASIHVTDAAKKVIEKLPEIAPEFIGDSVMWHEKTHSAWCSVFKSAPHIYIGGYYPIIYGDVCLLSTGRVNRKHTGILHHP
jgi:hypothetical protein